MHTNLSRTAIHPTATITNNYVRDYLEFLLLFHICITDRRSDPGAKQRRNGSIPMSSV